MHAEFDPQSLLAPVEPAPDKDTILARLRAEAEASPGGQEFPVVEVEVDPSGRLARVRISATWRRSMGPAGLADALLTAYRLTVSRRMAETAVSSLAVPPPPADRPPPDDLPAGVLDVSAWAERTRRRLKENRARLDALKALREQGPADTGQRRVTSPLGCFTATVSPGGIVGLEGNTQAILGTAPYELEQDAVELFALTESGGNGMNREGF